MSVEWVGANLLQLSRSELVVICLQGEEVGQRIE